MSTAQENRKKHRARRHSQEIRKGNHQDPFLRAATTYGPLLDHNYHSDQERRFRCIKIILEALTKTMLQSGYQNNQLAQSEALGKAILQELEHVLCRCFRSFGDTSRTALQPKTVRDLVLRVLQNTAKVNYAKQSYAHAVRKLLLEFLSLTFGDEEEENDETTLQLLRPFRLIVQHQGNQELLAFTIPYLKFLASTPLTDSGHCEVRSFIRGLLLPRNCVSTISVEEFPEVVECCLCFCHDEQDAISQVRQAWCQNAACPGLTADNRSRLLSQTLQVLISWGDERFKQVYLNVLKHCREKEEQEPEVNCCLAVDLAFLLYLKKEGEEERHGSEDCDDSSFVMAARILDGWIASNSLPFHPLQWICDALPSAEDGSTIWDMLVKALTELAIHLVVDIPWKKDASLASFGDHATEFVLNLSRSRKAVPSALVAAFEYEVFSQEHSSTGTDRAHHRLNQVCDALEALAKRKSRIVLEEAATLFVRVLVSSIEDTCPRFSRAVQTACVILPMAVFGEQTGSAQGLMMPLIRKLLWSETADVDRLTHRGMLLATEIFRSGLASAQQEQIIWSSLIRFVLPPQRKMIQPDMGLRCLAIIRTRQSFETNGLNAFKECQALLSNTGLIQSLANFDKQSRSRTYPFFLGFTEPQECLLNPVGCFKERGEQASLLFCAAYFIQTIEASTCEQFALMTKWAFELVDTYIGIVRTRASSKWDASAWLRAAVELPALVVPGLQTTKSQKAALAWLKAEAAHMPTTQSAVVVPNDLRATLVELLSQDSCLTETKEFFRSLFQISLGLYVAAGVCAAVVKNAFELYRSAGKCSSVMGQGLLNQIGTNLQRAYALRRKLESVDIIAVSLKAAIGRASKTPTSGTELAQSTRDFREELATIAKLREIFVFMDHEVFGSSSYFCHHILVECVIDGTHNDALIKILQSFVGKQSMPLQERLLVSRILQFKHFLLERLFSGGVWCLSQAQQCGFIEFALELAALLPNLRQAVTSVLSGDFSVSSLSRLVNSYLQLVIQSRTAVSCQLPLAEELLPRMLALIRANDDLRVAGHLLELLTILVPVQSKTMDTLIDVSFRVLQETHSCASPDSGRQIIPFAVRQTAENAQTTRATIRRVLNLTLCRRYDSGDSKQGQLLDLQRSLLLRHFGLLCLSKRARALFKRHTHSLASKLGSIVSASAVPDKATGAPTKHNAARKANARKTSTCCFNTSNFAGCFETLLHISVGAFASFQPDRHSSGLAGPYSCMIDAVVLFSILVNMYTENSSRFPKSTATIVLESSRLMLEATSTQVNQCILWRNSQPLGNQGHPDPGALNHLKIFIKALASCVCGALAPLGQQWFKEEAAADFSKGKSLSGAIDKTSAVLSSIASTHKLGVLRFDAQLAHTPTHDEVISTPQSPQQKRLKTGKNEGGVSERDRQRAAEEDFEDNVFTASWFAQSPDESPEVNLRIRCSL